MPQLWQHCGALPEQQPKLEAVCLEALGDFRSAAECHLSAGNFKEALNCYRSIPDLEAALRLVGEIGDRLIRRGVLAVDMS